MSTIGFVFAADLEDAAPQELDRATAEPEEEILAQKWPLEESMYIRVFKDALSTILEHEGFLFSEAEIIYLKKLQALPVEALYILIRLALRKDGWHRRSDYERYGAAMEAANKLDDAIHGLCAPQDTAPDFNSRDTVESGSDAPIDLTFDSDSEDGSNVKMEDTKPDLALDFDPQLTHHALSHEDATPQDLLDMLSSDELGKLAKDYKLKTSGKKRKEVTEAILKSASNQSTLSFFARSTPLRQRNINVQSKSKPGSRLKELCLKSLGQCIKLNPHVLLLIRRLNLLFFRTTTYEAQLFVPAILVACKKRKYSFYNVTRTTSVFPSRQSLVEYEEALALEAATEEVLEKLQASVGRKKMEASKDREGLERNLVQLFNDLIAAYNACLPERRTDQRRGLERFEPGYVYVRTLYHISFPIGKVSGLNTEIEILANLVKQDRWLLGKRGACYDRIACIYMKDLTNRANAEKGHDIVTHALLDKETRFRYRPRLVRRLTRLENVLDIPAEGRHTNEGKIQKCDELYILGERLNETPEEEAPSTQMKLSEMLATSPGKKASPKPTRRTSGKTLWESESGEAIGVEEFALEYYAGQGFKGKHCEGRITRFLFGLIFHDILFHPSIPGAFETAYQTAPLDLAHDTFYSTRKGLIDARLKEILIPGRALEIAAERDHELRKDNIFFVGGRWDSFERQEILEIVEILPEQVIHDICQLQAMDFEASGGGVPDLILWSVEKEEVKFVEVKSPSDKLSETQKLWIHYLLNAGAIVEVCHVETVLDQQKRAATKEKNRERAKSRSRSKSVASTARRGRNSVAESEEDDEEDEEDDQRSDYETLDVDEVKSEIIEDVKPSIGRRGRKRDAESDAVDELPAGGQRVKRIKTEE